VPTVILDLKREFKNLDETIYKSIFEANPGSSMAKDIAISVYGIRMRDMLHEKLLELDIIMIVQIVGLDPL
jgi:hypothetical protein